MARPHAELAAVFAPMIFGVVGVWVVVFLASWVLAPAWLDLERESQDRGEGGPMDVLWSVGGPGPEEPGPPIVSFATRGQNNRFIPFETSSEGTGMPPISAIRFITPRERIIYADDRLPAVIRLTLLGRLVVKQIGVNGMVVEERRSRGTMVEVEIYRQDAHD
jgi:hypothetical protein